MKIPAIKALVEQRSVAELRTAEEALMNEETLPFEVSGEDEGEQLTHIMAASWILLRMDETGNDFKVTLREYTSKVRESISS